MQSPYRSLVNRVSTHSTVIIPKVADMSGDIGITILTRHRDVATFINPIDLDSMLIY